MTATIITEDTFESAIKNDIALMDFGAEWCGPCKAMLPTIDAISEEYPSITVGKIDIDSCQSIAATFGIHAVPTLIYFKDGEEVARVSGVQRIDTIKEQLDSMLGLTE